ncbi:MAG: hypothetical protein IT204_18955 [Fimbriimonadaceae bacterium]|nr:hypothetical protein [Fimbriimonadaceae bacterium]
MAVEVRIMGFKNCSETRRAQRFFAERRVKVHFIDLGAGSLQPGELRHFAQRLGVNELIDRGGAEFGRSGLAGRGLTEERWLAELAARPRLLRTPLCRCGAAVTVGAAPASWADWLAP